MSSKPGAPFRLSILLCSVFRARPDADAEITVASPIIRRGHHRARVAVTNVNTGAKRETQSNELGNYTITLLDRVAMKSSPAADASGR